MKAHYIHSQSPMPTILQVKQSVECAQTGLTDKLRSEQSVLIERVNADGVGFMARDLRDVHRELNHLKGMK